MQLIKNIYVYFQLNSFTRINLNSTADELDQLAVGQVSGTFSLCYPGLCGDNFVYLPAHLPAHLPISLTHSLITYLAICCFSLFGM